MGLINVKELMLLERGINADRLDALNLPTVDPAINLHCAMSVRRDSLHAIYAFLHSAILYDKRKFTNIIAEGILGISTLGAILRFMGSDTSIIDEDTRRLFGKLHLLSIFKFH